MNVIVRFSLLSLLVSLHEKREVAADMIVFLENLLSWLIIAMAFQGGWGWFLVGWLVGWGFLVVVDNSDGISGGGGFWLAGWLVGWLGGWSWLIIAMAFQGWWFLVGWLVGWLVGGGVGRS